MDPPNKRRRLAPKLPDAPATAQVAHQPPPYVPESTPQQSAPQYPVQDPVPIAERHDFESFARHLQDAAMLISRHMQKSPYTSASVLLIRWEEDRSAEHDIIALETVFRERYNYHTDRWTIPTVPNPSIKVSVQMASFMEHARSDHLLIVYYAGHCYVSADNELYWACNPREDASKLKWNGVRCLFEDAQSDMLLLLDTCAVHDAPGGSHGVKQAIAAYGPDQKGAHPPTRSFTATLSDSLYKLSGGRPFTVQRLYDEIMQQRQQDMAAKLSNGAAKSPVAPERTPLLFPLTPGKSQNLSLAPLPQKSARAQSPQPPAEGDGQSSKPESPFGSAPITDLTFDEGRVLVCTTFVGDASPDMVFFNQWIQQTPAIASKITMEGMFLGPPTMLLISMPQSIWSVVQHDKVCCFLGYINSHNMIDLYKRLVGSGPIPAASSRAVEDGRILLEAREVASSSPANKRRHEPMPPPLPTYSEPPVRQEVPAARNPLPSSAPSANQAPATPLKDEVEDSAEMKEAAEQLKALSHVRHMSGEAAANAADHNENSDIRHEDSGSSHDANESGIDDSHYSTEFNSASKPKLPRKALAKAAPKQDTRCTFCSHAPFKDSSSLRKHVAAAHTRPFPCAFSFAGCASTFGSKNEWKRHIASQHLCLQYYRCSSCPQSTAEGKGNEFNRKDLFTQHLRRMHAPFTIKKGKGDVKMQAEWETHVKEMQQSCLVTRREPPQRAACPKTDCQSSFEGPTSWDEWTEHVGRHMEKGEGQRLGVDQLLAKWALDENIIEETGDSEYKLCALTGTNGVGVERDANVNGSFVSDGGRQEDDDPNSIVVATSTMHDRMDLD